MGRVSRDSHQVEQAHAISLQGRTLKAEGRTPIDWEKGKVSSQDSEVGLMETSRRRIATTFGG
jgi:hypothetical protein